ncbi:MAG: hypothetical protein ACMXYM_05460 [Candidatus Woesearchaeota archaeon]
MLIGLLSTGKGTWGHVSRLLEAYDTVHLLTNEFGAERFTAKEGVVLHTVLGGIEVELIKKRIVDALKPVVSSELEVDVNLASGSGIEHMALIAALFELGVGFKLVYANEGVQVL